MLAARGGSHALTHQAIDGELGIAKGSTSYYYRTRSDLISAVADYITSRSRQSFRELLAQQEGDATTLIDTYVQTLATSRAQECRARLALLLDADCAGEQRAALATCLFDHGAATELYKLEGHKDPEHAATTLLDRLEGRLLRHTVLETDR